MAATITLYQERTNIEGGHRIYSHVTESTLIPPELFLFKEIDDTFSHVASVEDLAYPTTPTVGIGYYRLAEVTQDFSDVGQAIDFAADIKRRLQLVATAYTEDVDSFDGSETTVITG